MSYTPLVLVFCIFDVLTSTTYLSINIRYANSMVGLKRRPISVSMTFDSATIKRDFFWTKS